MPPYTPRRVSAERDFPPGCGPWAVLTPGDRPTPYSRPLSAQRDYHRTLGTYHSYLRDYHRTFGNYHSYLLARSFGSTPYSRPLSAQRDYHRTLGTYHSYLRDYHRMFGNYHSYLLARSFGSGEAMELTTAPPLAAPDATATTNDDEEAEEENYWMPDEIDYVDAEEVLAESSQGVGGPPPAAPDAATATTNDDEEAEEENYWMPDEIDYVDAEEVLAVSSQGVGGLPCRIPRERIDYDDDVYYDDGVSVDMINEFLRTMSSEEAAANGGVEDVCVVCQDDLCREDRTVGILECGHRFHADCVGEWLLLKNLCPLCKAFGIGCFT